VLGTQLDLLVMETPLQDLNHQLAYWNRVGPGKSFGHPVNFERLDRWLNRDSRILDLGCGYGRVLGSLFEHGYHNLHGFDPAPAMVALARERYPLITFEVIKAPPRLDLHDASVDAVLLFSVLTCVPTDEGQRAIIREAARVMRPGGLLYISDLWLQTDERNTVRYLAGQLKYGTYGVFDLPEGVIVRHHDPRWIEEITQDFDQLALDAIDVHTMNGNAAQGFQWFGSKRR
jgi:SAM-dependent methyltransferase